MGIFWESLVGTSLLNIDSNQNDHIISCNQITFDFNWVATWWRSNYVYKSNIDFDVALDKSSTAWTKVLWSLNSTQRYNFLALKKIDHRIHLLCGFRFMPFLIKSIWWSLITSLSETPGCFRHYFLNWSITFKYTASPQWVLLHFYFTFPPMSKDSGCIWADKNQWWRVYGGW